MLVLAHQSLPGTALFTENRQHDYDAIWVQIHQFTEQYGHIYIRSFSVAFGSFYWETEADGHCDALGFCRGELESNRCQAFQFTIIEETIWTSRQIPWAVPPRQDYVPQAP